MTRGLAAIAFGILTLSWPQITLFWLIIAFAAFTVVDGISSLVFAARGGTTDAGKTWPLILTGVFGVAAGFAVFVWPALGSLVLLYIVAFWAIVRGVTEIAGYFPLRQEMESAWLLLISGGVSVVFGVVLLASPVSGILALLWVIGLYAIVAGGTLVIWSFSLRSNQRRAERKEPGEPPPSEPTPA